MTAIHSVSAASSKGGEPASPWRTGVFAGGAVATITEAGYLAAGRTGALAALGGWLMIIIMQVGREAPRARRRQWAWLGLLLLLGCIGGAVTLAIANGHAEARLVRLLLVIVFASAAFFAEATIRIVRLEWARSRTGRLRFGMCWTGVAMAAVVAGLWWGLADWPTARVIATAVLLAFVTAVGVMLGASLRRRSVAPAGRRSRPAAS